MPATPSRPRSAAIALAIASAAVAVAALAAGDDFGAALKQLKVDRAEAEAAIQDGLRYSELRLPRTAALVAAGQRAAIVGAFGEFARAWVQSEGFLKWYAQHRDEAKPDRPEELLSAAELRQERIAEAKAAIADQQKECAGAKGQMKEACDAALGAMKQALAQLEKVTPAQDAEADAAAREANADRGAAFASAGDRSAPMAPQPRTAARWRATRGGMGLPARPPRPCDLPRRGRGRGSETGVRGRVAASAVARSRQSFHVIPWT